MVLSPPPTPSRTITDATVLRNHQLCREHYRLTLHLPHFPATAPGQFVQLQCSSPDFEPDHEATWPPKLSYQDSAAFLRRPFSLAGRRDTAAGAELEVIHRVVGLGTDWLSRLRASDTVSVLGPLGNRFTPPPPDHQAILVGGGVGIPPMLYLASSIAHTHRTIAISGAQSADLLALTVDCAAHAPSAAATPTPSVAEFAPADSIVCTDDGSFGFHGYVTAALERYLDNNPSTPTTLYTCGPELMMKRVAQIAIARNIPCQIAVERAMACGMGTCQSCCIRVKKADPAQPPLAGSDWCYRLACTDGPIFSATQLLW